MILIIFAHPHPHNSHANKALLGGLSQLNNVHISDLYEQYPDFHIDKKHEQNLLLQAKLIVFQFPLYWYNVPAMLKQWQEVVLDRGFAFGKKPEENQLSGKQCLAMVTTGHKKASYQKNGFDNYSMTDLLHPLEQMSLHCKMDYLEPQIIHQAHRSSEQELETYAQQYRQRIEQIYSGLNN